MNNKLLILLSSIVSFLYASTTFAFVGIGPSPVFVAARGVGEFIPSNAILTENESPLLSENNNFILTE